MSVTATCACPAGSFIMVATYPSYMNETPEVKQSFSAILSDTGAALRSVMRDPITRKPLLSSSTFMAVFASLKHYIQPILAIHGAQMLSGWRVAPEQRPTYVKVLIGVLYAVFYLCAAVGTRNSHRLKACFRSDKMAMDVLFIVLLLLILAIGICMAAHATVLVIPLYLLLYVVQNLWKPWSVSAVSDLMGKERRALVLSVDSMIQTTLEFLLAPLVGYVATALSIEAVFLIMGPAFLLVNAVCLAGGWDPRSYGSSTSTTPVEAVAEQATSTAGIEL